MTTTNVEKLVYNIFERKNWIIEQIKQQTYLYEQQLASNLLIQGINPPPWFLNPNSHSLFSDPRELNKEELISDLLLPHARLTFPYSTGQCYFQNRPVGTGDNGELLDRLPNVIHNSNKDLDAGDEPRLVQESHGNHVASNCARRQSYTYPHDQADVRVSNISIKSGRSPGRSQTSQLVFTQDGEKASTGSHMVAGASKKGLDGGNEPMNLLDTHDTDPGCIFSSVPKCYSAEQTEARIANIDIAPDQSLARLQRSKSRQKALELRTSGKATKSHLSHENKRISFSGVTGVALYGIDPEEPDHYKGLSIINKSSDMSNGSIGKRVASRDLSNKSGTSNNCGRMTRSRSTCQWPSSVNEPSKLDVFHETVRKHSGKENCTISQFEGIDLRMENGTTGQLETSKSSCLHHICPNESLKICRTSTTEYDDGGRLSQLMDYDNQPVSKEIEVAIPFDVSKENSDKLEEAAMETLKVREQESSKYACRMTRSMSSSQQHSSVNDARGLGASYYIPEVDGGTHGESTGKLSQQLDKANDLLEVVKPSSEVDCIMISSKNTCHFNELVSSGKSFGIADPIVAPSGSGATEEDPLVISLNRSDGNTHKGLSGSQLVLPVTKNSAIVSQEEKVPSAIAFELEGHPTFFGSNLDKFNLRTEAEGLVRLGSDAHFVVKPKQLNFNVLEDCTLNEACSPPSVVESPEQYLQRTCHRSLEPESVEKSTSDCPKVSLEMQLLAHNEACKENNDAPKAYETNLEDCNKSKTKCGGLALDPPCLRKSEAYTNGNHQVYHSEDGLEAVLPSDLHKGSYLDMHQPNCHLTEGCAEQRIDEQQFSGSSAVPSLTKLVTDDPKSFLDEEVNMKNQPDDDVLDARRCCSVDDENNSLQHKHNFDCENEDTFASTEKMSLANGCNDLAEEGSNTSASVGDPQNEDNNFCSSEFGEAQPTYTSTLPKNKFRHTKYESWPQFKRRKIEYQHTNCFSASTSSRKQKVHNLQGGHISSHSKTVGNESDVIPKLLAFSSSCERNGSESSDMLLEKMKCPLTDDTFSSLIQESRQEDGNFCFTEKIKVVQTPFTSEHEEFGPSFVSSLSKQVTRESQGSFVEKHTTSFSPNDILAAKSLCDEQELQKIFHVGNDFHLADAEILSPSRSALPDSNPHLKEGGPVGSPCNNELAFDQNLPVYEGFVLDEHSDDGGLDTSKELNFGELNTTRNSMQRASILEKICRNASICTPLVHFSSKYKPLNNKDQYLSVPNRLLEHTDLTSTLSFSEDAGNHLQATSMDEVDSALQEMLYSDSLPYSGAQYSWNVKNCDTPVGRYCKRISSSSVNSEKRLSSNPELTCFRIEEDSSVVDENENADDDDDHIQEDIGLAETNTSANGEPFSETIEEFSNPPAAKKLHQIGGTDSSNAEIESSVKQRLRNHCSNKKSKNWGKENQLSSVGANSTKVSESLHNRFSKAKLSSTTSLKRGTQRLSEKVKRNNIVSNVSSFIPLVKQRQAAAVCKGKRDIKVRSLEAAEAAKRQAEKKENERKIKKEALKLERAKIEEETLRQRELDKRKKEEELKKKDADLAARKRMREEEGRKEKERKRKRIGVGWQTHRAQEEEIFAGKGKKEKHCGNPGKSTNIRKESDNRTGKGQHVDKMSRDENTLKKTESQTEFKTNRSNIQGFSIVPESGETLNNCDGSTKLTSVLDQLSSRSGGVTQTATEKSYEMSPYQHSDEEEEEEEDEVPTKKFIPSWASKKSVALVLSLQQQVDPSVIFPRESFCSMNEALLPRHLQ